MWIYTSGADFGLDNSSFDAFKLTKNLNPCKYYYYGQGIGFSTRRSFSLSDGSGSSKNVMTIGADMSSSVHIDNRKQKIF